MTRRDREFIDDAARRLKPLLEKARTVALCTHVNPDGDGIGAEICLHRYLRSTSVESKIINTEGLPLRYRFLDPDGAVEVYDAQRHAEFLRSADLVFMLDNSSVTRLGALEAPVRASRATTVCIDHHDVVDPFWTINIVDEDASATGELVFQIIKALGGAIDMEGAQAAYVSLVTDTGYFRFSKTSPRSHEAAAEMLALGVRPPRVFQEVYERNSAALVKLGGVALTTLQRDEDGAARHRRRADRRDAEGTRRSPCQVVVPQQGSAGCQPDRGDVRRRRASQRLGGGDQRFARRLDRQGAGALPGTSPRSSLRAGNGAALRNRGVVAGTRALP
jgi:nanoRNase/pAp phosphatase (c-di-AMP/oligoRNAs hydrolase)